MLSYLTPSSLPPCQPSIPSQPIFRTRCKIFSLSAMLILQTRCYGAEGNRSSERWQFFLVFFWLNHEVMSVGQEKVNDMIKVRGTRIVTRNSKKNVKNNQGKFEGFNFVQVSFCYSQKPLSSKLLDFFFSFSLQSIRLLSVFHHSLTYRSLWIIPLLNLMKNCRLP